MRFEPLGDRAAILRDLDAPAHLIAEALTRSTSPGLIEAVACYDTVGLYFDGEPFLPGIPEIEATVAGKLHVIPVCYELGPDLEEASSELRMSPKDLVLAHSGKEYDCFVIGFCPGFPYLGFLDPAISGLARLPSPRTRVEPGSVAIVGDQTAIYPLATPGGWRLIGQTPLTIVDVEDGYFPIQAGDRVRFAPIAHGEFTARRGERL